MVNMSLKTGDTSDCGPESTGPCREDDHICIVGMEGGRQHGGRFVRCSARFLKLHDGGKRAVPFKMGVDREILPGLNRPDVQGATAN